MQDYIDEDVIEISDGEEEDDEGSGLDDGTGVGNVIWEEANAEPPVAPGPGLKPAKARAPRGVRGANVVNSAALPSDLESGAAEPEPASSAVPAVPPPNAVQRRPRRARRLHPNSFQHGPFHIAYRDDSHGQSYQADCPFHTRAGLPRCSRDTRTNQPDPETVQMRLMLWCNLAARWPIPDIVNASDEDILSARAGYLATVCCVLVVTDPTWAS